MAREGRLCLCECERAMIYLIHSHTHTHTHTQDEEPEKILFINIYNSQRPELSALGRTLKDQLELLVQLKYEWDESEKVACVCVCVCVCGVLETGKNAYSIMMSM
jgi:hypothetical protein